MDWKRWIDIETLRLVSHHTSGVAFLILGLKIGYWLAIWGFEDGTIKTIMIGVDEFVTAGLLVVLAWRMLKVGFSWIKDGKDLALVVA